jgi:hypothetical protein
LISPSTPIYIDINLGRNIQGQDVAKTIKNHGFKSVNLSSAGEYSELKNLPWIDSVQDKFPPWHHRNTNAAMPPL